MTNALTAESLGKMLGREIEDIYVTIAKASALGMDVEAIASSTGLEKTDVEEVLQSQDYKDVRLLIGVEMSKERVERDLGWDGVESVAVRKLQRKAEMESDTDTLLRIAAVANRATRRAAPQRETILDPTSATIRVPLQLTRRFTEKLNGNGAVVERSETQQISVLDGSALNPTFKEVNELLRPEQPMPRTRETIIERATEEDEPFSLDSIRKAAKDISDASRR